MVGKPALRVVTLSCLPSSAAPTDLSSTFCPAPLTVLLLSTCFGYQASAFDPTQNGVPTSKRSGTQLEKPTVAAERPDGRSSALTSSLMVSLGGRSSLRKIPQP